MSDYLARAASRATPDTAPTVRPRLHSRYEGLAVTSAAGPVEQEVESLAPQVAAIPPTEPSPVLPRTAAAPPPPITKSAAYAPAVHASQMHAAVRPALADQMPSIPPSAPPPKPQSVERIIAPTVPAPAGTAAVPEVHEILPPGPPAGHQDHFPQPPAPPTTAAKPLTAPLLETPRAALPPPTPPAATVKPSTAPLLETPRTALPPPTVSAPPSEQRTVNITIGRLEIRAATPAPDRPRQQPTPARGPLALDEFLRGKSPRRRTRP